MPLKAGTKMIGSPRPFPGLKSCGKNERDDCMDVKEDIIVGGVSHNTLWKTDPFSGFTANVSFSQSMAEP
jgi:hypothetical protein